MKNYNFKEFIQQAHSEKNLPSSKRLYGGIGWIVCQLCLITACILSFIKSSGITDILKEMWIFDLITSSALLGLSTITGAFGANKSLNIGKSKK